VIDWLFTNALAALALAAIAGTVIWTFRPSPAVRHALWLVVVLKLVSPTGLVVSVPLPVDPRAPVEKDLVATHAAADESVVVESEIIAVTVNPKPDESPEEAALMALKVEAEAADAADTRPASTMQASPPPVADSASEPIDYRPYLLGVWVAGALVVGWRQLRETVRFARFTARALPAGDSLMAEVAIVANRLGVRVPAVRVLTGLTSPVMWCLWRPVLLWPAGLECRLKADGRRAVLAHELAHLRRRDHWVRRLEMVAAVLHWWNPLFWLARKKLRADAELACDAWATGQADRRAYAEALLEVCSFNPRRRPAPAVGVIGEGRRAMQERLTMIMRDRVPCRLAFGAKLVVALMAIAAVPAWTFGQADELVQANPAADKQMQELEAQIKALAAKLEELKANRQAEGQKARATEALKRAQELLGEKLKAEDGKVRAATVKALAEKTAQGGGTKVITSGEGGIKVIGPDGKEIKDAKVIIGTSGGPTILKPAASGAATKIPQVIEAPGSEGKVYRFQTTKPGAQGSDSKAATYSWTTKPGGSETVTLSRATYKLNKDQAAALGTLLGSVKASVMEAKVDGENVIVTTTPDVQATIGQIVRLVQGQTGGSTFRFNVTPATPATPASPAKPAKPAKPGSSEKPSLFVPGTHELNQDALKHHIELELKQLDNLKDLKNLNIDVKALEDLKNLKIDIKPLEELKKIEIDLSKLKDLEKLRDLKELKDLDKLKELKLKQAEVENARQRQFAEVEKVKANAARLKDVQKAEAERLKEATKADAEKLKAAGQREKAETERSAELEKAIKALIGEAGKKPGSEKKPDGPAK